MQCLGVGCSPDQSLKATAGILRPGLQGLQHQSLENAAAACAAMAPVVSLREFRPLVSEFDFYQEIGLLQFNRLTLMSYVSAPVHCRVDFRSRVLLTATFAGSRLVRTSAAVLASRPGSGLLFPPGSADASGSDSAVVIALRLEDLQRVAAVFSASPQETTPFCLFRPRELERFQARQLHSLLRHLDACALCHPALPAQLGLDDVLLRLVVSWLLPELSQPSAPVALRVHARSSFDALLDYIRANLDQPLRLSDLEAQSHYSSRALQYAFRERLGCTPRQWIRLQRLERAMEQLQQAAPGVAVKTVALACGYRHLSQFSGDFKRRFGMAPSAVLRTARGGR